MNKIYLPSRILNFLSIFLFINCYPLLIPLGQDLEKSSEGCSINCDLLVLIGLSINRTSAENSADTTSTTPTTTSSTPLPSFLRIYTVTNPLLGNMGLSGADAACMADPKYPGIGTYKAMMSVPGVRQACTTANCSGSGINENIGWVLLPNMEYRRSIDSSTVIFTTNASAIFVFGTLTNAVDSFFNGLQWTGLNNNWTNGDNCTNWTQTTGDGVLGRSDETNLNMLGSGTAVCTSSGRPYCVEQHNN
jgi:hypothetical protein